MHDSPWKDHTSRAWDAPEAEERDGGRHSQHIRMNGVLSLRASRKSRLLVEEIEMSERER